MRIIGRVSDRQTGKPLAFANVYYSNKDGTPDYKNWGTTTDETGTYDLGSDVGSLNITASYVGYNRQTKKIPLSTRTGTEIINFELEPANITLTGVEIFASKPNTWLTKIAIYGLIGLAIYGIYRTMKPRI